METRGLVCGLLCQHPSCWETQRHESRGHSRRVTRLEPVTSPREHQEDEGEDLPTQNVVNLLEDYGEDPEDRYPTNHRTRRSYPPPSTPAYSNRSTTRGSYSKMKTPMVTPASLLQSSSINIGQMTPPHDAPPSSVIAPLPSSAPGLNKVEVQEVFDLDDLRSDWHDTFVARQFYVWMPNANAVKKEPAQTKRVEQAGPLTDSSGSVLPRDLTELMVPREIGWERAGHKMMNAFPGFCNPKKRNICSPKSPQQGLNSFSRASFASKSPKEYYGLYELLDLPRDVLVKVLDHVDRRDLVDRDRLTEALTRAFPKLECENSSLSMAYGDVLQQRKISLRDDRPQRPKPVPISGIGHALPNKQVYLMDVGTSTHVGGQRFSLPPDVLPQAIVPSKPATQKPTQSTNGYLNYERKQHHLPRKAPLPSIPTDQSDDNTAKIASVSLGLPQLPSGVKITKPFNYKQQYFDFTLGPVPQSHFESLQRGGRIIHGQERPPSPALSDHASSTGGIVVTMPAMPTGQAEALAMKRREVTSASKSDDLSTSFGFTNEGSWDLPEAPRPLHAVSPSYSTNVPKAPAGTPSMFRQGSSGLTKDGLTKDGSASPTKANRDAYASPLGPQGNLPVTGVAIHKPTGLDSPEATGMLDTIRESEPDEQMPQPADYRLRSELPKSRRSVRFAADIPCQPPSSPNSSDRSESPLQHRAGRQVTAGGSMVNNASTTSPDILTVHGSRSGQSRTGSLPQSRDSKTTSTDAWPQVNEDLFDKTPTPPTTAPMQSTPAELDQSIVGQYDITSELSDLVSRETSFHSSRQISMIREHMGESPGPPPPSPEPKDLLGRANQDGTKDDDGGNNNQDRETFKLPPLAQSSATKLVESSVNLDDLVDSDSEMTISAKPPSNIDDLSRIQTPATPQRTERNSLTGNGLLNQSHDVIPEVATVMEEPSESSSALPPGGEADQPIPPVDILITPGTRPSSESPTQEQEPGITNPEYPTDPPVEPVIPPQLPAYTQQQPTDPQINTQNTQSADTDEADMSQKLAQLDQFQSNDETFKEELQEELGRLTEDDQHLVGPTEPVLTDTQKETTDNES